MRLPLIAGDRHREAAVVAQSHALKRQYKNTAFAVQDFFYVQIAIVPLGSEEILAVHTASFHRTAQPS